MLQEIEYKKIIAPQDTTDEVLGEIKLAFNIRQVMFISKIIMNHLNYFEPYQSKSVRHEDNLTRAFLVVLRHSISSLMLFYDQAIKSCITTRSKKGKTFSLPFFSELDYKNLTYHTQKSEVSDI
ncbi:MAG: hypothetical protein Q8S01_09275, partial [Ignavibacteria bacterium]|nr:hypothetical protein [Ignavibacteria bacterium]